MTIQASVPVTSKVPVDAEITALAPSAVGDAVICGTADGRVLLWKPHETAPPVVAAIHNTRVVSVAMARDGLVPRGLSHTGSRGTPVRTTVLVSVIVAVLAGLVPLGTLEEMVNIGTLFAFVLVSIGVIVLRRTRPDLERGSVDRGARLPATGYVPDARQRRTPQPSRLRESRAPPARHPAAPNDAAGHMASSRTLR